MEPYVSKVAAHGQGQKTAAEIFAGAVGRMQVFSLLLFGAGLAVLAVRKPLVRLAAIWLAELKASAAELMQHVRESLRRAGREGLGTVIVLTAAGAAVRIAYLSKPLLWDEGTTFLRFAWRPAWLPAIWYPEPNNHVLHSVLVSVSRALLGEELWALRLPALVAGILMVPVGYAVAQKLYGRWAGLLAGCLLAVSPPLIGYSVNSRGYSLMMLCFLVLIGLALYLRERDNLAVWLAFAVTAALGLYTVPLMLYPLAVVAVWLGATFAMGDAPGSRLALLLRLGATLVFAVVLAALLYGPILLISGPAAVIANEHVASGSWPRFFSAFPFYLGKSMAAWRQSMPTEVQVLLGFGVVVALLAHRRINSHRVPVALAAFIVPVLIVLQRVAPGARMLVFLFPLFILTAAGGLNFLCMKLGERARAWVSGALVLILALAFSGWWGYRTAQAPYLFDAEAERTTLIHGKEIVSFLQRELRPGDRVLYSLFSENSIKYYFRTHKLERFLRPKDPVTRLVVVVNGMMPAFPLGVILGNEGYAAGQYASPLLLLDLGSAQVYEVLLR
ncbi:MAG: glycosyltransferase family 39 protein [Candidatus Acidiferrales bacterium]